MNGKKLLTILLCVMLIGTLLPAGVFASENGEVSAASAVSVSEDGSNALSADSAGKPADKQTAENEQAIPAKADEKMAASDNSEKMAPAESGKKDVQEGPVQSGTEPEDEKAQEAEEVPEKAYPAFSQSRTVNGVIATVSAGAGVFPEDAVLSVAAVPGSKTETMIEGEREADANVVSSYTFDIKVLDADGREVQPKDGQAVSVSFAAAEVADANLDTQIWHISDEGRAEALEVNTAGQTATTETTGFSLYTVEFTYNDLQYILPGGKSVALSEILNAVGLAGEPTAAASSDPELFAVENADGIWTVVSRKAFSSTETLTVTISGRDYVITVTDDDSGSDGGYGLINGIPAADGGYVWMGGDSPVKWHVIGANDSNWLLISSDLIDGNGNIKNWYDAKNYCGTLFSDFSGAEQAAVPVTAKSEPDDYSYKSNYGSNFGPSSVNANMFLLSSEEAETYFSSNDARKPGLWWLRSPFLTSDSDARAGIVFGSGAVGNAWVFNIDFVVRPAFQLNLSSVLFSSAAEGGKSSAAAGSGEFGTIIKTSGDGNNEIKLTLTDSARSGFSASAETTAVSPGGTLDVNYSGVTSGDYVSALLCNTSGEILYYASKTPEASGEGTWSMTVPADLADGSYTIKVFSEQSNGNKKSDYASPASEIALTVATLYTVTFVDEDGTTVLQATKEYPSGTPAGDIEKPADPAKEADAQYTYTFAGWDPEIAEVTGDATYKATYKSTPIPVKKSTLTFELAGGTLDGKTGKVTIEANVGDTIKLPEAPMREGYTFQYWKGSRYEAGADYKVEGDHAFTAVWEESKVKTYTVKFDANGHGKAPDSQTVEEGKKASKPKDPTASGYTFGGWFTDKECKSAYSFDAAVTKDITLYAKWTKNSSSSDDTGKTPSRDTSGGTSGYTTATSAAKTGDESQTGLWFALMAASLLVLLLIAQKRKGVSR